MLVATDVLSARGRTCRTAADRRELRPAVGHHPPDPAGRARRPHRPAGGTDPLLLVPCRPTASSGIIRLRARVRTAACARTREVRRHRRGVLRGRDESDRTSSTSTTRRRASSMATTRTARSISPRYAYQIWKNAIRSRTRRSRRRSRRCPTSSTRRGRMPLSAQTAPTGVLVYVRTGDGNDALAWIDEGGTA